MPLTISLLSLCTQCPLIYADLFHHQISQAHHASTAKHCASPSATQHPVGPFSAHHVFGGGGASSCHGRTRDGGGRR
jgi:hypothetical protein